jgi:hypothetical protein
VWARLYFNRTKQICFRDPKHVAGVRFFLTHAYGPVRTTSTVFERQGTSSMMSKHEFVSTTFYFIRHGETAHNNARILQVRQPAGFLGVMIVRALKL